MSAQPELLPACLVPRHYDLDIDVNLSEFVFAGRVQITAEVKEETDVIVLHALDITIKSVQVTSSDGSVTRPISQPLISLAQTQPRKLHKCDGVTSFSEDTISIQLERKLACGEVVLDLSYDGELNSNMCGFYRSKALIDGKEEYMAVTQHEPTDCRRTLPCFDEPALKASFDVTLRVPAHLTALSNMPVKDEIVEADRKVVRFERTPRMSTYLLAMAVGRLEHVEGTTKKGVKYRVYACPGVTNQCLFALDVGMKVLDFFSDYFGISYPLPKLDMIALPDFAAGAMENWGLITYREANLLIDEVNSPLVTKQRVAYVVAHELAHQWFGNLVTMSWWTDLWLNEGFATWVGNFAVDHLYKHWDIWTQFVNQYAGRALQLDALETSHAIEVEVKRSGEVNEIFDEISYCKGAACIMMLTSFLGMPSFRSGISSYLNKFQYGNASTRDLWESLTEASGKDVEKFMGPWTRNVGYPVVFLSRSSGKLSFAVERFLATGKEAPGSDWWVPMRVLHSSGKEELLDIKGKTLEVEDAEGGGWVKGNLHQTAFFRIRYDDALLALLGPAISELRLSPSDRLGVQADAFALARAGKMRTDRALALAMEYEEEEDFTVWADLLGSLADVMSTWAKEAEYEGLQQMMVKLLQKIMKKVGWEAKDGEGALFPMLRPLVILNLGRNGDEEVAAEARRRMKGGWKSVAADLRYAVYATVVGTGGAEEFEVVKRVFLEAEMSDERNRAMRALCATREEKLMDQVLAMTLDGSIRSQDVFYVFGSLSANRVGMDVAWRFLQANWSKISGMFPSGQPPLARIIKTTVSSFASEERAAEVEAFFADKETPGAEMSLKQALETIRMNAAWLQRDRDVVGSWLASK